MIKLFQNYFRDGFVLANKSLEFAFITILFSLFFSYIPQLFGGSLVNIFLNLINVIVVFFSFGFTFSLPLFLLNKQKNKITDWNYIFETTIKNTKRLIIPGILLIVSIFVFTFVVLFSLALMLRGSSIQITQFLDQFGRSLSNWNLFMVIFTLAESLLIYTPLFFSLESKGLFDSIKKSLLYAFRHFKFTLIIIGISEITYTLISLLPVSWRINLGVQTINSIIYAYINLVVISSILFHYQKHKN